MLAAIYASFNKAVAASWATIAPGVPIYYGHPTPPATLPPECLRLYWLDFGAETERGGQIYSLVQLDIRTPNNQQALALRRAEALSAAMRLGANSGGGRRGIYNASGVGVGVARVTPLERGWVNGADDADPGLIILSRTVQLLTTPIAR